MIFRIILTFNNLALILLAYSVIYLMIFLMLRDALSFVFHLFQPSSLPTYSKNLLGKKSLKSHLCLFRGGSFLIISWPWWDDNIQFLLAVLLCFLPWLLFPYPPKKIIKKKNLEVFCDVSYSSSCSQMFCHHSHVDDCQIFYL